MGYQKTTGSTYRKINLDSATDKLANQGEIPDTGWGGVQESIELYKLMR